MTTKWLKSYAAGRFSKQNWARKLINTVLYEPKYQKEAFWNDTINDGIDTIAEETGKAIINRGVKTVRSLVV